MKNVTILYNYVESFRYKYHRAKKGAKSRLLNEFCEFTGYERKYSIKLLAKRVAGRKSKGKKRGAKSKYDDPSFLRVLKKIWFLTDQMSSNLLKIAMPDWVISYEKHYGELSDDIKQKLLAISARTIDRKLKKVKASFGKGRSGTKPGKMLRREIPVSTECWDEKRAGFLEADTVALCGGSLMGNFVWCLTAVDIATTWTEVRAHWNKGAHATCEQIECIEKSLPFKILGFDTDCGGEFINYHLVRYFQHPETKVMRVAFTRSRPYHKNDNAHVEQKNWSHVRKVLGYSRFGHAELVPLLNDVLKNEFSLLRNHFYPTMKLDSKMMIKTRYKRFYGTPETPYSRVMKSKEVGDRTKERLQYVHDNLDPISLRNNLERKLKHIFALNKKLSRKHESFYSA